MNPPIEVLVFGNVTLDVICYPVNEVPRYESVAFEDVTVSPGGCGSNTAIGLAACGIPTALAARTGDDDAADLLFRTWHRVGVDTRFARRAPGKATGTSIVLVDDAFQPRFVHTSGANVELTTEDIQPQEFAQSGVRLFHIAGFFALPNLFDHLASKLEHLRALGITTLMDVVLSVRMDNPKLREMLWQALPHLDFFMANATEAFRLTGERQIAQAAQALKARGPHNVIIKSGAEGCYVLGEGFSGPVKAFDVPVVDTTGAGDAFAAGLIAALAGGAPLEEACQAGNQAGARVVQHLGAITAWLNG